MRIVLMDKFDRRRYSRLSVAFDVFLLNSKNRIGTADNISPGGFYLKTRNMVKPGMKLILDFKLPEGLSSIKPYCEVKWIKKSVEPKIDSFDVGIQFLNLYENDSKKISEYITSRRERVDSDSLSLADFINIPDEDILKKTKLFWEAMEDVRKKGLNVYGLPLLSAAKNRVLIYDERRGEEKEVIMMGTSNYLGLTVHRKVIHAAVETIERYGTGTGSVSLLSGTYELHRKLEEKLAELKGCEAAIVFPTGHMANIGCISALLGKKDIAIIDKMVHTSILDGCVLSRGSFRTFRHSDTEHLRQVLESITGDDVGRIIIIEGVNGLDGDVAPLPEVVEIANEFGAKVMIDDAHATGVIGEFGRGTAFHFDHPVKVDVIMDSLSKSLGSLGGYIASSREVIRYLQYFARTSFFSVSAPPGVLAAALSAIRVMQTEPELNERLWENIRYFRDNIVQIGFNNVEKSQSAIFSTIIGNDLLLRQMNRRIFEEGVYVEAVPFPAVPRGGERLRLRIMATHTKEDLDRTLEVLEKVAKEFGVLKKCRGSLESRDHNGVIARRHIERKGIEVAEISSYDEFAESLRFSWTVYSGNSLWIPYFLVKERTRLLSGDYLYFKNNVDSKRFIVRVDGKMVGTASAFIDRRFINSWKEDTGFIGYFEALPNHDEAVSSLFERASDFLESQGAKEVWAPINIPFLFYGGGLLTKGYKFSTSFLQPYNPDYYVNYFERAGFRPLKHLPHYSIDLGSPKNIDLVYELVGRSGIRIRELDWSRFEHELSVVHRLLNESFPKLWKYVPFEYDEFVEFARNFKDILIQGLWLVAEIGRESVGFVGAFPQCASIFRLANGELEGIDLHLISNELDRIKEGAIVLLGVRNGYRGRGIGLQLIAHLCSKMIKKGYKRTTCTWEISDDEGAQGIVRRIGGQKDELEWTIFQKPLTFD
jgi:glycine C-acetyltransferase